MTPDEPTSTQDRLLAAARRLDWRFLLPDPRLGRVLYVGDAAGPVPESLRMLSGSLTATSNPPGQGLEPSFDVAVVCGPTTDALQIAARALRPGGVLYVEVEPRAVRPRRRTLRAAAVQAELRRLGLSGIGVAWHWPDFQSCTRIIPLTSTEALRYAARVGLHAPAALEPPAGALLRAGVLSMPRAALSVVARRSLPPINMAADYLATHRQRFQLQRHGIGERPALVVVTPRFRASSHVIYLVLADGTSTPALAVKVPRLAGQRASLDREARQLRAIHACRPGGFDSIPAVLGYDEYCGHQILVETALHGDPMDRRLVRRDHRRCCDAILAWLVEVQSAARTAPDVEWHARLIELPIQRLALALGPDPADDRLLAETYAAMDSLRHIPLPLVFEHGDLSHPNLLLTPTGGVGVLDWETANPAGLPACDLFFFLAYVALARRARWSRKTDLAVFDGAFFGPSAWARPYIHSYATALQLPASTLVPLFLLTWARYLASQVERLQDDIAAPADATALGAWLRATRFYSLWRHALANCHRLNWND